MSGGPQGGNALYGAVVAEHWKRPRNFGALESPDLAHEDVNPLCGDRIRLELRVREGRIAEARFRGDACMVATAATSMLTERLVGLTLDDARAFSRDELLPLLQVELRPARVACALLPLEVLRGALASTPLQPAQPSTGQPSTDRAGEGGAR